MAGDIGERRITISATALGLGGDCTLRGIAAHSLEVGTDDSPAGLRYLRITESPALRELDLSACNPHFELQLDSMTAPEEIVLPEGGVRLFVTVRDGFPAIRIKGRVLEAVIECVEGHPTAGTFVLDASDGLALLPGDELEPVRGISRYVRIDQSERGLQYKDLRRRAQPNEILWKLADAKADEYVCIDRITRADPDELSRLALGTNEAARAERREWLDNVVRPEALCAHLERALLRGAPPLAIWALRCMLQRNSFGDPSAEMPSRALLSAGPVWKTSRSSLWPPRPVVDDLYLWLLLRSWAPVRRCERRLTRTAGLHMLEPLILVAARLPARHPWLDVLQGLIAASIQRGRMVLAKPSENRTREEWQEAQSIDRDLPTCLHRLIQRLEPIAHRRIIDQMILFSRQALSASDLVRLGSELHQSGTPAGRGLVVAALESGESISPGRRAMAVRCLLGEGDSV